MNSKVTMGSLLLCAAQILPAFGQTAMLPREDPGLKNTEESQARQKDVRDSRVRQQGEAKPSGQTGSGSMSGDPNGVGRQDTGLSDPSVNPGQASGMQRIQGRIIKSDAQKYTVRQLSGDVTLMVDAGTAGDKDLHPGDIVTGMITQEGRAVMIHKEPGSKR